MAAKRKIKTVADLEAKLTEAQEATARAKKENVRLSSGLAKARDEISLLESRLKAAPTPTAKQ